MFCLETVLCCQTSRSSWQTPSTGNTLTSSTQTGSLTLESSGSLSTLFHLVMARECVLVNPWPDQSCSSSSWLWWEISSLNQFLDIILILISTSRDSRRLRSHLKFSSVKDNWTENIIHTKPTIWNLLKKTSGSTEIWTRIAGFRVLSANHYTMEP